MIKKESTGYLVDIRPQGRDGKRFRKTLPTKQEAVAYEKHIIATHSKDEPWQQTNDKRRLSDLCESWYELHGKHLKSGSDRNHELKKSIETLGNPIAKDFTAKDFTRFRAKRLDTVTANTANHDLTNFRSLFNELKRLGEWSAPNPMEGIRRLRMDEPELEYLTHEQITQLLDELDNSPSSHARISARICLSTGARWGETAKLTSSKIKNGQVHFSGTKSGKNRSIPISQELETLILDHAPLVDGMNTFKRAIAKLEFNLPKGQKTHVLRHTFASHFMINGGNIITLQRILGHGTLAMTVRYAHLSPDHLTEVLTLNPISNVK